MSAPAGQRALVRQAMARVSKPALAPKLAPNPAPKPQPEQGDRCKRPVAPTGEWRTRAACRNEDPELFFPVGTTGPAIVQALKAKAVCARCPVRLSCLDEALRREEPHGILGGLGPDERQELVRRSKGEAS